MHSLGHLCPSCDVERLRHGPGGSWTLRTRAEGLCNRETDRRAPNRSNSCCALCPTTKRATRQLVRVLVPLRTAFQTDCCTEACDGAFLPSECLLIGPCSRTVLPRLPCNGSCGAPGHPSKSLGSRVSRCVSPSPSRRRYVCSPVRERPVCAHVSCSGAMAPGRQAASTFSSSKFRWSLALWVVWSGVAVPLPSKWTPKTGVVRRVQQRSPSK